MQLRIMSHTHFQEQKISWLEVITPHGSLIIQPGHAPSVLTIASNSELSFGLPNGKKESLHIKSGIVHVTRYDATALIET